MSLGEFSTNQGEFERIMSIRPPFGTVDVPPPPYNHTYVFPPNQVCASHVITVRPLTLLLKANPSCRMGARQ